MAICYNTRMKILKFGAVWCAGCLVMKPRWREIEAENPWLETRYFEYDDSKEMVDKWHVGKNLPVFSPKVQKNYVFQHPAFVFGKRD